MSKYQKLRDAVDAFEPGAENTPIVYTTAEVNEKLFRFIAGRKLKLWSGSSTAVLIVIVLIMLTSAILPLILIRAAGGAVPVVVFVPFVFLFATRPALVSAGQNGLRFYFLEIRLGKGYVVSDMMILPYEQIEAMEVTTGKVTKNTSFTFMIKQDGKLKKIKTSASAKMRKAPEHAENLQALVQALENKN